MDISEENIISETEWKQFFPAYADIPSFRMKLMALDEIMSEKFRALVVRKKARDAYDIWFLLNKGMIPNIDLIENKLDFYGLELKKELLEEAFADIEKIWNKELRSLMAAPPDLNDVKRQIDKSFK